MGEVILWTPMPGFDVSDHPSRNGTTRPCLCHVGAASARARRPVRMRAHETTVNVAGAVSLTLNLVGRFDSDGRLPTSVAGAWAPRLAANLQRTSNLS
jgi:hypothetical protein